MSFEPAARYLAAELVPRRESRLRKAGRFIANLSQGLAGLGMDELTDALDLVVWRRDTGAEVLRTPADVGSPEYLLAQVRDDLATLTITEFFAQWRAA